MAEDRDRTSAALMLVGFLLVIAAGMNGLFWFDAPGWLRFVVRIRLFAGGLLLVAVLVARWSKRHVRTFTGGAGTRIRQSKQPVSPEEPWSGVRLRAARELIERELAEFQPLSSLAMTGLTRNLFAPESERRAVHERKTLTGAAMEHEVTLDLRPGATIELGNSHRVVLLARPRRRTWYGRLAASAGGDRLMVLSLTKSLALLYAACTWPIMETLVDDVPEDERDRLLDLLADLIVYPRGSRTRRELVRGITAAMDLKPRQRTLMVELIRLAHLRRPVLALVAGDEPLTSVTYSYTTGVSQHGELPIGIDSWRRFKDELRQRLQLPSKFVSFPMDRARAASSYVLDVHIPAGLYVDETYVLSRGQLIREMPREVVRSGFISWTVLNGRSDVRVATWELRNNKAAREPVVFVRMVETPPGSVFTSFLVASAVLLSVWLTGVATSTLAPSFAAGQFNAAAFGVVTLAITLPGLLSSWWGVAFSRTAGSFRSLTGLISLTVSIALSLAALVLYIARFAVGREFPWDMPEGKTIFLIHDFWSFGLFALALINVGVVLGLFAARLWRFQSLKRGDRPD